MLSKLKLHRIKLVIKETHSKDPEGKKRLETSDSNKEEEFDLLHSYMGFLVQMIQFDPPPRML
jgi:hypothetical protein